MLTPLPSGIVTFMFSDIQGSTPLWEQMPAEMRVSLAQHHSILRRLVEANQGQVFQIVGDEFQSVFSLPAHGLNAAIEIQRALQSASWGVTGPLKVRMGLHTGPGEPDPSGNAPYVVSHTLNRAARIMSSASGGQILLSQETADLVSRELPVGTTLLDLGEHRMKGMQRPEHLFQVCVVDLPSEFPPLATGVHTPNNLPVQLTSFIGREAEVAEVVGLLRQYRMVTLTGTGGTGKTRLSLKVAEEVLESFPAGVWFIELAPISNPAGVPYAVAAALGLQESIDLSVRAILINYLMKRRLLLILDNCEHLTGACAELVDDLLRGCPDLTILATSREALRVNGELAHRVPSLSVPDPLRIPPLDELSHFEGVHLFTERAATSRQHFLLTSQNASAVVQICQRLDGIPLAIELAAARVGMLSVEQIHARLDQCFRLLTMGARTTLPRHQTLRGSIDWSYSLLIELERLLLERLSIFVGGWTLEAAEAVCGFGEVEEAEVLDLLTSLVDKSLIIVVVDDAREMDSFSAGNEIRYQMLETIRQYAAEQLAGGKDAENSALEEMKGRHLDYFARLADHARLGIGGHEQAAWINRLKRELENIRAGLDWALRTDSPKIVEKGLGILNALEAFWYIFGHARESLVRLEAGLAYLNRQAIPPRHLLARTYNSIGVMNYSVSDYQKSLESLERAITLLRAEEGSSDDLAVSILWMAFVLTLEGSDLTRALALATEALDISRKTSRQEVLANCLFVKGIVLQQTDLHASRALLEESVSIFEKKGDLLYASNPMRILGSIAMFEGDFERAHGWLQKSLAIDRQYSAKMQISWDVSSLGDLAYFEGQHVLMKTFFEECHATAEECGFRLAMIWSIHHLGVAARRQGYLEQSTGHFNRSLALAIEHNFKDLILENLAGLAGIAADRGQLAASVKLLGMVAAQGLDMLGPITQSEFARDQSEARAHLSEQEYQAVWEEGQKIRIEQALELIREIDLSRIDKIN